MSTSRWGAIGAAAAWLVGCNALFDVDGLSFQGPPSAGATASSGGASSAGGNDANGGAGAGEGGAPGGRDSGGAASGSGGSGGAGGATREIQGVTFDGAAYLHRNGPMGAANATAYVLSLWYRVPAVSSSSMDLITDTSLVSICRFDSGGKLYRRHLALGSDDHEFTSTDAVGAVDASWHHLAMARQYSPTTQRIYLDGSPLAGGGTVGEGDLDLTSNGELGVAARGDGQNVLSGDLAELYFATGQYLELTEPTNLAKLRAANGHPADIGDDGSLVTGTPPTIYLSVRAGGAATDFASNRGTGGDFTVSGTLTLSATQP